MKTADKLKALDALLEEARQETIEVLGRDILQLLARHGFQVTHVGKSSRPARANGGEAQTQSAKAKVWSPPPPGTDAYRVLRAIQGHAGQFSAEVKRLAESGGKPIKNKTFRTALSRLKERGFVTRDKDGRWHPASIRIEPAA